MANSVPVITAVVIPARNEQHRIGACLRGFAAQGADNFAIVLVANNCTDQTSQCARQTAEALGLRLEVLDCNLSTDAGVGTARSLGFEHALTAHPGVTEVLTTDADCVVAPDWIIRNRMHLRQVAAVCGLVTPMQSELAVLDGIEPALAEMEGRYERLVMEFYRRALHGPFWLEGEHGCAAGASLAITTTAYRDVGGFADLSSGEDRDLVRRLKVAGHSVHHAADVRVAASCRLEGRAGGGMADALRARVDRTDYLVDDSLPSAHLLIDAANRNSLGPWPLRVAPGDRLRARNLAQHIAMLEEALSALQPAPTARRPLLPKSMIQTAS